MASEDMMWIMYLLGVNTAYPLDSDTATAIDVVSRYAVITWEYLDESETIGEWITDHFRRLGKTELPPKAYRSDSGDPDDEILALFEDAEAYNDFVTEKDYSYGFTDVHDAEYEAVYEDVIQAMKGLTQSGKVKGGVCVHLEQVPVAVLATVPLVDNVWLDRYVVELAEWYALLEHKGFERYGADDDHPMAWDCISLPATRENRPQEINVDQVNTIRNAARANLAKFKGKTKTIDGRVYLHFDDYCRWRSRKVKERLDVTEGILLSSWNAWVGSAKVSCNC